MPTSAVARSAFVLQRIARPSRCAPWPRAPLNSSAKVGTATAPATGPSSSTAAIDTAQPGSP